MKGLYFNIERTNYYYPRSLSFSNYSTYIHVLFVIYHNEKKMVFNLFNQFRYFKLLVQYPLPTIKETELHRILMDGDFLISEY